VSAVGLVNKGTAAKPPVIDVCAAEDEGEGAPPSVEGEEGEGGECEDGEGEGGEDAGGEDDDDDMVDREGVGGEGEEGAAAAAPRVASTDGVARMSRLRAQCLASTDDDSDFET
jgi:hypothetical protein